MAAWEIPALKMEAYSLIAGKIIELNGVIPRKAVLDYRRV